jgi:hypothetical protein
VKAIPTDLMFFGADFSQYAEADSKEFDRYTSEFETLGFEHLADYRVAAEDGSVPRGVARLFHHSSMVCFAEVNQVFPPNRKPTPVRAVIGSILSDGWSIATSDRDPESVSYLLRRPRGLWVSSPGSSPRDLLTAHRGLRQRIMDDLRLANITPPSAEGYFSFERGEMAIRRAAMERKNIVVALIEVAVFSIRPKHQWLGDYGRFKRGQ